MTRRQKSSTDVGGAPTTWVDEPGMYHMAIAEAADGAGPKGAAIQGCSMLLTVLAGPEGQADKQKSLVLWDADTDAEGNPIKENDFNLVKQTAYGVAINQIDPSKLGQDVDLDFGPGAVGQQIMVKLGYGRKKEVNKENYKEEYVDDPTKIELSYADIFHVDDPRSSKYPKNAEALALIPKESRKPAEYFAPLNTRKAAAKPAPKLDTSDL